MRNPRSRGTGLHCRSLTEPIEVEVLPPPTRPGPAATSRTRADMYKVRRVRVRYAAHGARTGM